MNKLIVMLNADGTVRLNARGMSGTETEILSELGSLAQELGGELTVEKHERHRHAHVHRHVEVKGGRR